MPWKYLRSLSFPRRRESSLSWKCWVLWFSIFLLFSPMLLRAEKYGSPAEGFSVEPSGDWIELPLPFQGVVVSYGKKGTLATFHITERDIEGSRTIDHLRWEDLFSPEFGSIDIRTQGVTKLGGEKAKYCVYVLRPGEFKRKMEGRLAARYMNYVLMHGSKLISITFKDTEDGFALTYPSFLAALRTFRFAAPVPPAPGREA
jgi:hypothetical protein